MENVQNNKSPGNYGTTKELVIVSVTEAKNKGEFSISQRQAVIKLMEKKIETKDK